MNIISMNELDCYINKNLEELLEQELNIRGWNYISSKVFPDVYDRRIDFFITYNNSSIKIKNNLLYVDCENQFLLTLDVEKAIKFIEQNAKKK